MIAAGSGVLLIVLFFIGVTISLVRSGGRRFAAGQLSFAAVTAAVAILSTLLVIAGSQGVLP